MHITAVMPVLSTKQVLLTMLIAETQPQHRGTAMQKIVYQESRTSEGRQSTVHIITAYRAHSFSVTKPDTA